MDDKQRKTLLLVGLGIVVVIYSMRSTADGLVMKPIRDLQIKLASAQDESESLTQQQMELEIAKRNVKEWKETSLPRDVDDAQRLYREWVFELTRMCGFSGSAFEVTPGSRSLQKEYTAVAVEVKKAETDLQGLTRFLYLFEQSSLLHRISAMKIDSPGAQGNPRLSVSLTAEGMSLVGSDDRSELLPRTLLTSKLTESATAVSVMPSELFPTFDPFEPFVIRIERELLRVEAAADGEWKVQRGVSETKAVPHDANAIVELLPVSWARKDNTLEQYAAFVKASVFVIPSPPKTWNPRLSGVADKTIKPGEEVRFTAKAESLNPELGDAAYALSDAVEGMRIDATTGEFLWTTPADQKSGKFTATVLVTQADNPELKLNSKLNITVKSTNVAPVITVPATGIVVIGREFTATASATDDGPAETLKYSLGSGSPEGLAIDSAKGIIKWTPSRTFTPGKYDVEVTVTDAGEEPKSASGRINLDVQEDNATFTVLSATLSKDGVWFAWFRNKATGKTEKVKAGETLAVSEIKVELVSIANRFVTMRDADGVWKLSLGDILRDRKLIEPAPGRVVPEPAAATPVQAAAGTPSRDSRGAARPAGPAVPPSATAIAVKADGAFASPATVEGATIKPDPLDDPELHDSPAPVYVVTPPTVLPNPPGETEPDTNEPIIDEPEVGEPGPPALPEEEPSGEVPEAEDVQKTAA